MAQQNGRKGCQFMERQMRLERFLFIQNCLSQAGDLTEFRVMYHGLIHACGYVRHDRTFSKNRSMLAREGEQSSWKIFHNLSSLKKKYEWNWTCPSCNSVYLRQRKSNGRYACRHCKEILVDVHRIPQNS